MAKKMKRSSYPVSFWPPPRSSLDSCGASAAPTSDAEVEQACPPYYDVGALKALFHHVQAVLEEKHHTVARGRGHSRGSLSRSSVGPGDRNNQGAEAPPSAPPCASEQSCWLDGDVRETSLINDDSGDEGVSDRGGGNMISALGCEGATSVVGTTGGLQKALSPLESARILGATVRRVSDLEVEILPRPTRDDGATLTANRAGVVPEPLAPRAGGAFARLVVVKELQPVPEHAPEDARHLLELTLDHQQVIFVFPILHALFG